MERKDTNIKILSWKSQEEKLKNVLTSAIVNNEIIMEA